MYSCIYKRKYYPYTLNKKNIGEGSHTVTVLEKRSSSYYKEVQRIAYRCLLPNAKRFILWVGGILGL